VVVGLATVVGAAVLVVGLAPVEGTETGTGTERGPAVDVVAWAVVEVVPVGVLFGSVVVGGMYTVVGGGVYGG